MQRLVCQKILCTISVSIFLCSFAQSQSINLKWIPREDLNVLLPASVRVYEANGFLSDNAPVRAMYATIDLRDDNLRLQAIGSNTRRETTWDTYHRHRAILAING